MLFMLLLCFFCFPSFKINKVGLIVFQVTAIWLPCQVPSLTFGPFDTSSPHSMSCWPANARHLQSCLCFRENTLLDIKCLRSVLQWIPSHCGIDRNEEADRMAKLGAGGEQENAPQRWKPSSSLCTGHNNHGTPSYHQLLRPDQVVIFHLRTGHNRLLHHLHRKLHLVPPPRSPCGKANQTAEHILQDCRSFSTLRGHSPVQQAVRPSGGSTEDLQLHLKSWSSSVTRRTTHEEENTLIKDFMIFIKSDHSIQESFKMNNLKIQIICDPFPQTGY